MNSLRYDFQIESFIIKFAIQPGNVDLQLSYNCAKKMLNRHDINVDGDWYIQSPTNCLTTCAHASMYKIVVLCLLNKQNR